MMAIARTLRSSKVLYPALIVAFLGLIVGLQYCPMPVRNAPDFTLPMVTLDGTHGDRMRLGDQRGKVVLVDFWATWCGPCRMSTPALVRLGHRYRERGLVVIGINTDESGPGEVPAFMRHYGIDYPMVYDDGGASNAYRIRALPTTVLIDRQGRVRRQHEGMADESDLAGQIEELL